MGTFPRHFTVCVAMLGLHCFVQASSSGGKWELWCSGFSLQWLVLFPSIGSGHSGFSSGSLWVQ